MLLFYTNQLANQRFSDFIFRFCSLELFNLSDTIYSSNELELFVKFNWFKFVMRGSQVQVLLLAPKIKSPRSSIISAFGGFLFCHAYMETKQKCPAFPQVFPQVFLYSRFVELERIKIYNSNFKNIFLIIQYIGIGFQSVKTDAK